MTDVSQRSAVEIAALYHRMQSATGEEFELLWSQYCARAEAAPELVAAALASGAIPVG